MRVALADDSALFREGLAGLLSAAGHEVVAVAEPVALSAILAVHVMDAVILDIRMPPTFTDEGITAALRLRAEHPPLAILVLSTYVQLSDAVRLLEAGADGIGYLLKDRVDDVAALGDTLLRLAAGATVLDPAIVTGMLARSVAGPLDILSPRERTVLKLMAEGRSNAGISGEMFLSPKTVERHIATIFDKLGLQSSGKDNRRILAVLTYLKGID